MLRNLLAYIWGTIYFSLHGIFIPVKLFGYSKILRKNGSLLIGKRITIWPKVKFSVTAPNGSTAQIKIGDFCTIGDRTEFHSATGITVGDHVRISWDCVLLDHDYHGEGKPSQIIVEDNVWIGCRSIILKGVKIGKGAVVAAGSVVTKDVVSNTLVAGNPAVFKKNLYNEDSE